MILASVYLLWAYQRCSTVSQTTPTAASRRSACVRPEFLGVIIAIIVFTGVYPKPMLDRAEPMDALIRTSKSARMRSPEPTPVEAGG